MAALDVSIQAQVLNLFIKLRQRDLTYLFISHDLGVVDILPTGCASCTWAGWSRRLLSEEVFRRPNHPYTQALLAEVPRIDTRKRAFAGVRAKSLAPDPPSGCHFHPRCPFAMERCKVERPVLRQIGAGHRSACHLNDAA